eukprot:829306-Rhodomonas_salina.2
MAGSNSHNVLHKCWAMHRPERYHDLSRCGRTRQPHSPRSTFVTCGPWPTIPGAATLSPKEL